MRHETTIKKWGIGLEVIVNYETPCEVYDMAVYHRDDDLTDVLSEKILTEITEIVTQEIAEKGVDRETNR